MKHLGLVGGIGVAATEYYYRSLADAHSAAGLVMDLTITHANAQQLIENVAADARERQAKIFERHIQRLQAAGAECAALTSVAAHFCIEELRARSPLQIVSVVEVMRQNIERKQLRRVGLLGTRSALESKLYGGLAGLEVVVPRGEALDQAHTAYIEMAVAAHATEGQRATLFALGRDLCQKQGAEAVLLAGTDLFLAFEGQEYGFPIIDTVGLHVAALVQTAEASGHG